MLDDGGRRSYLRWNLQREITNILWTVVKQEEFAEELAEEHLDPASLVREVSADPALMERSVLEYEPVLDVDQDLATLVRQRPPFWEPGWRMRRANAVAIFFGLAIPTVAVWAATTFTFERGTITGVIPLLLMGASLAAVGFLVRNGLPASITVRLRWEVARLGTRLARRGQHQGWRKVVRDDVVVPFAREWINRAKRPTFDTTLTLRDASGLLSNRRDSPLVQTRSIETFRRELSRPDPGAIGIAGPRGAGKTTLIERTLDNAFTPADQPPFLTVTASAPARYDAREFILHLYAVTCRAVLDTARPSDHLSVDSDDERIWRRLRRRQILFARAREAFRVIIASASYFILGVILTMVALGTNNVPHNVAQARITAMLQGLLTEPQQYLTPWHSDLLIQIVAVASLAYSLVRPAWLITRYLLNGMSALLLKQWRNRLGRFFSVEHKALHALARYDLRRVRFLQTRTEGWTGKLSGGGFLEFGLTSTIARAERPLTHPEIVDDYRRLLDRVVTVLAPGHISGIIVAIDELDKLADAAQAREFIDEVKGVFGTHRCLFLVSVSEDALTSFHRRGIPVRDAFDSAFTTVIRADPFTLKESRAWLAKRAIGIPEPFIHLCHSLAGGLPRELRRVAMTIHDLYHDPAVENDLSTITAALVRADLSTKLGAFAATAAHLDTSEDPQGFLDAVTTTPRDEASWMLNSCAAVLPDGLDDAPTALNRLRWEAASYLYFSATITEFFTNDLQPQVIRHAMAAIDGGITTLATARQRMSIDPRLGWRLLTEFREYWDLATITNNPTTLGPANA